MKNLLRTACFLLLACMGATTSPAQKVSAADMNLAAIGGINRAMDASAAAWNRGDIRSFMDCYDNSPETTFVGKKVEHGWQQVLDNYLKNYDTPARMGHLDFSETQTRLLDEDTAVMTGRFKLTRSAAGGGVATGIFSLVWRKTPQGWKIVLDHTGGD